MHNSEKWPPALGPMGLGQQTTRAGERPDARPLRGGSIMQQSVLAMEVIISVMKPLRANLAGFMHCM